MRPSILLSILALGFSNLVTVATFPTAQPIPPKSSIGGQLNPLAGNITTIQLAPPTAETYIPPSTRSDSMWMTGFASGSGNGNGTGNQHPHRPGPKTEQGQHISRVTTPMMARSEAHMNVTVTEFAHPTGTEYAHSTGPYNHTGVEYGHQTASEFAHYTGPYNHTGTEFTHSTSTEFAHYTGPYNQTGTGFTRPTATEYAYSTATEFAHPTGPSNHPCGPGGACHHVSGSGRPHIPPMSYPYPGTGVSWSIPESVSDSTILPTARPSYSYSNNSSSSSSYSSKPVPVMSMSMSTKTNGSTTVSQSIQITYTPTPIESILSLISSRLSDASTLIANKTAAVSASTTAAGKSSATDAAFYPGSSHSHSYSHVANTTTTTVTVLGTGTSRPFTGSASGLTPVASPTTTLLKTLKDLTTTQVLTIPEWYPQTKSNSVRTDVPTSEDPLVTAKSTGVWPLQSTIATSPETTTAEYMFVHPFGTPGFGFTTVTTTVKWVNTTAIETATYYWTSGDAQSPAAVTGTSSAVGSRARSNATATSTQAMKMARAGDFHDPTHPGNYSHTNTHVATATASDVRSSQAWNHISGPAPTSFVTKASSSEKASPSSNHQSPPPVNNLVALGNGDGSVCPCKAMPNSDDLCTRDCECCMDWGEETCCCFIELLDLLLTPLNGVGFCSTACCHVGKH